MVDFAKLKAQKQNTKQIDPIEIFRRLPKPPGINDLYTSQAEVLEAWYQNRNQRDIVLKLHTGGGKTLVGLLVAQSKINETNEPALYLTPTIQLVKQTVEKAKALGISAVAYEKNVPLNDAFINGKSIMVSTYKALFHGKSKFGIRGSTINPVKVGAVILDDAHVAFPVVRDSFTLMIVKKEYGELYQEITGLFRRAFIEIRHQGSFDDVISGAGFGVMEIPYWAWQEQLDAIRGLILKSVKITDGLVWPLLRDNLHLCHALVSRDAVTVTPYLPIMHLFPTFSESPQRIYMSATIADDSEIVRTFDADSEMISKSLSSRSLAGISERMILVPELMPFESDVRSDVEKLLNWTATKRQLGAVVLVPSDAAAQGWSGVATVAKGPTEFEEQVDSLQLLKSFGPVVFANRYDGIDLLGNSCRLLVMEGLPTGTSDYELYRASTLYGSNTISRMLAQRIEQGMGRGHEAREIIAWCCYWVLLSLHGLRKRKISTFLQVQRARN